MALTKITPQMFDTSAAGHDFNIDNGTFVVDASANRVGIGTTTPSTLLDVNGTATATTFVGALTGNVTGNVSGTAATVTGAAQTNITSLGTLTGLTMSGNLNLNDDVILRLGTSNEFQIYHTSSGNSIISETGSGDLFIDGSNIHLRKDTSSGETFAEFVADGAANLYHNGTKKFETASGGIAVTGDADISSTVLVGNQNSVFAENNLRFKSAGDAYIDHITPSTAFQFRGSESSALDSNILHLGHSLITAQQEVKVNAQSGNYNFRAYAQDGDSWFGVYDDANNSANIIVTRSDSAVSFRHLGHAGVTDILGRLIIARHGNTTETAGNAILKINGNTSNAFNHGIEYFNNALTAGEAALIVVGFAGSTKNSGYIGYRYNSAGSDGNMVTFGHWGVDNLLTIDAIGRVGIGTTTGGAGSRLHIKDANTDYRGELKFETGTGGNTGKIILKSTDNTDESAFIRKRSYYLELNAHDNEGLILGTNSTELLRLCGPNNSTTTYRNAAVIYGSGGCVPSNDNGKDLGSTSLRWRNIYTADLHLSNEGSKNDVDGTSGNWTIQEGETDLYIINNKSGKKYKFALEEID